MRKMTMSTMTMKIWRRRITMTKRVLVLMKVQVTKRMNTMEWMVPSKQQRPSCREEECPCESGEDQVGTP